MKPIDGDAGPAPQGTAPRTPPNRLNMATNRKQKLIAVIAALVTLAACSWIYFKEIKAPKHDVALHRRVGEVMAEQTAQLIGKKGRVILIAIEPGGEPELQTQLDAFKARLKKTGAYDLKEYFMDTKDQPKYGVGTGLSGRRFVRTVKKNEKADVVVSFIGAPKLTDEDVAELGRMPKFIAEARSPDHLPKLFAKHLIQVAVVSRFVFPAPGPLKPSTPEEWFDKRFQVIAADTSASIPKPEQTE